MTGTVTPWLSAHHLWTQHTEAALRPGSGAPRLAPHERVLARDRSDDGTECVATDRALHWRSAGPACLWSRVDWSGIDEVGWEDATRTLRVVAAHPLILRFQKRPRLAELAAERVAACHVLRRRVRLSDSCAATVVAYRDSDSGAVIWTACFDSTCDTSDPRVTSAMDDTVHQLRSQTGC
ncbi:MAG: hypothetical protein ACR2LX_16415 [Jatrophihabitans sp.]